MDRFMKVVVTFAVDEEFAPWRRLGGFKQVRRGPAAWYEVAHPDMTVRAVVTGMGAGPAREAARDALLDGVDVCISSGLAGALRPEYAVGAILVAEIIVKDGEPVAVASDRELVKLARQCGAHDAVRFLSTGEIVATAAEKRRLGDHADAVEMESLAVLAEAALRGVPAVAIRAISDAVETDLPYDFSKACDERGRIRRGGVLRQIVRRPSRFPALLRFAGDCRGAARKLALFLDAYTNHLVANSRRSQSELLAMT
jgi:adenosylhomocysteine nucleosidase